MNLILAFIFSTAFAGILPVWKGEKNTRALILDGGEEALFVWTVDSLKGFQVQNSKTHKILQMVNVEGDWTNLGPGDSSRDSMAANLDVNFDGHGDVLIESSHGGAGTQYRIFLYDLKSKSYLKSPENMIWNPAPDKKTQVLRGGPSDMKQKTYRWDGQNLIEKK